MSEDNKLKISLFSNKKERPELPIICEDKIGIHEWVSFGIDNLYPEHIIEIYNTSPIHNAILQKKAMGVAGNGIKIVDEENISLLTKSQFNRIKNNFGFQDSLVETIKKISEDFEVYGAFALEVIWDKKGTKICQVNHIDTKDIRIGYQIQGKIPYYFECDNWKRYTHPNHIPRLIAPFNPMDAKKNPRQLLYVKHYRSGNKYYGVPSYAPALSWMKLDSKFGIFHLSNLENGLNPGLWVTFKDGKPTYEEMKDRVDSIEGTHKENPGKTVYSFVDDPDKAPEIQQLESNRLDKTFIVLNDLILQNISASHGVPSLGLLGIKQEGGIGQLQDLENAHKLWENTVLQPDRLIIQENLNKLISYMEGGVEIEIIPHNPIELTFSESVLSKVMTVEEIRNKVGLEELPDEVIKKLEDKF
jgi:hypothetical protein